jgi:iron-regulated transporter 1
MAVEESEAERGSADNPDIEHVSTTGMQETVPVIEPIDMTRSQAFNLYTSHLLSTWNVRLYGRFIQA